MKELKALEILKDQRRRHQNMADSMKVVYFDDELDEAIKELEELNNRSCEGCKYETEKYCKGNFITVCSRYPRLTDRYEAKRGDK